MLNQYPGITPLEIVRSVWRLAQGRRRPSGKRARCLTSSSEYCGNGEMDTGPRLWHRTCRRTANTTPVYRRQPVESARATEGRVPSDLKDARDGNTRLVPP